MMLVPASLLIDVGVVQQSGNIKVLFNLKLTNVLMYRSVIIDDRTLFTRSGLCHYYVSTLIVYQHIVFKLEKDLCESCAHKQSNIEN